MTEQRIEAEAVPEPTIHPHDVTPQPDAPETDVLTKLTSQGTVEVVKIADLQTDPAYQRDLSRDLIERIKRRWDIVAAGLIIVSRRPNGGLYIVNGQHRTAAASEMGQTEMVAQVISGLDARQEAELRLMGNTARADSSMERFRAQVAAGHAESIAIQKLTMEFETRINVAPDLNRGINSVSAVEALYRLDRGLTLTRVFETIKDAFGHVGGRSASVSMLKAVAWALTKHPTELNRQRLIDRLAAVGVDHVDRKARSLRAGLGGPLWMNYYRAMIEDYNHRLPDQHRLEPKTGGWTKTLGDQSGRTGNNNESGSQGG